MKNLMLVLFGIAFTGFSQADLHAQNRRNTRLPKVDFKIEQIKPVGQGLAISVTNRGFVMSPKSTVSVAVYDLKNRQLLQTKVLKLKATSPNQTRRIIFVPPAGKSILVRAKVDPKNKVAESNERNNEITSRH